MRSRMTGGQPRRRGLWLVVALLVPGWAAPLAAQSEPPAAATSETESAIDLDKIIQERIRQMQDAKLDEPVRQKALDFYKQALGHLENAATQAKLAESYRKDAESAPEALRKIKEQTAAFDDKPSVFIPEEASLAELQQDLQEREGQLETLRQAYTEAADTVRNRAVRRPDLVDLKRSARQREVETKDRLAKLPADDTAPLIVAERAQLYAYLKLIAQSIARYETEEARIQAEQELTLLTRDLKKREVARAEEEVRLWREAVDRRRRQEQEEQARLAREQLVQAETFRAYPAVGELAERYRELTELRDRSSRRITELTQEVDQTRQRLATLRKEFQQTQERVEKAGRSSTVGLLLRKQRTLLPDVEKLRRSLAARQQETQDVQLILYQLNDRRDELADLDVRTDAVLATLQPAPSAAQRERLGPFVNSMLATERELLDTLIGEYENLYVSKLGALDTEEQLLADETERYGQFIGERVLWIRSTAPVGAGTFTDATKGLLWLARPASWLALGRALIEDAESDPAMALLALGLFALLAALQPRLQRMLSEMGAAATRGTAANFAPTARSLVLTGLLSILRPGLLWYLGWRLSGVADAPEFVHAAAAGLQILALVYAPVEFFRHASRPRGLADAHFRWPSSGLKVLRRNLRWLRMSALPMAFVAGVMQAQANVRWQDSLGRLAFLAALLLGAEFMRRVLRPQGGALHEAIAYHKGGWLDRLQALWYVLGVALPVALAVLAAAGYYYTAEQLVLRLYATVWLALGLLILGALVARWALVARRRIALEQLRQRREALAAEQGDGASDMPEIDPNAGLDASEMSLQTRQLLHSVLAGAAVVGLWFIWIDVLPALSVFEQVEICKLAMDEVRQIEGADGESTATTVLTQVPITLADVMLSILVSAITIVATKNIPGLLEMAILQRLPLDAASRYAISTLARYALAIVGTVATFGVLHIGWQKVQWLAAAITLGLGFGLQEIFANFVSGLIILFERPIRVGDIVTVGDVSGVVSRIRMRATTITDWDRKEMIIPNKDLITGRVLNWTLSDPVNRVIIQVGVAYGTDTEQAVQILERAAREHERVLKDPSPSAAFIRFGESTLDLELRCYLPSLENRGSTIHELHTRINADFAQAGIEIPFPQRDLHVRTVNPAALALAPFPADTPPKDAHAAKKAS